MSRQDAMAAAIRRGEWERIVLCLLLAMDEAARRLPPGTIEDLLALLSDEAKEGGDGGRERR